MKNQTHYTTQTITKALRMYMNGATLKEIEAQTGMLALSISTYRRRSGLPPRQLKRDYDAIRAAVLAKPTKRAAK